MTDCLSENTVSDGLLDMRGRRGHFEVLDLSTSSFRSGFAETAFRHRIWYRKMREILSTEGAKYTITGSKL